MKKLLFLLLLIPQFAFAAYTVPLSATTTTGTIFAFPTAVNGVLTNLMSPFFFATSTTRASTFPYASSTVFSATTICITGDICRTTWPSASISGGTAGMLTSWTNSTTLTSTDTPTAGAFYATSTTATSTFLGGVRVSGASPFIQITNPAVNPVQRYGLLFDEASIPSMGILYDGSATLGTNKIVIADMANGIDQFVFFRGGTSTIPYASSTALTAGNLFSTNATTSNLGILNVKSSLINTTASGDAFAYAGSNPCTNQVALSVNGAGVISCTSVTNAMLSNSSLTINSGTGLQGGGAVSLGGTINLSQLSYIATSSAETNGQVAVFGSTSGTPAKIFGISTSTPSIGSVLNYSGTLGTLIGGSSGTFGIANNAVTNGMLANSTISGIALGSNLNALTTSGTLSGSSYNGSAAVSNWAIDLTSQNVWTAASTTFVGVDMQKSTSTAATSTSFYATQASTTRFYSQGLGCASGMYLTWSAGNFGCATDQNTGGAFPFTTQIFLATSTNATTTLMGFYSGFYSYASSTIGGGDEGLYVNGNATTTGTASSTFLFVSKSGTSTNFAATNLYNNGITSALGLYDAVHKEGAYAGSNPCTNQVALSISASGVITCTSISNAMITNSSVTIGTGGILTGGAAVSLGNTINLSASSSPTLGFLISTSSATSTFAGPVTIGTSTPISNFATSTLTIANNSNGFMGLQINTWTNVTKALSVNNAAGITAFNVDTTNTTGAIFSVGSTSPKASLAVHAMNGDTNVNLFMVGSSTQTSTSTFFEITNAGTIFAPSTTPSGANQTGYWCYDGNGQFIRDTTVCLVSALKFKKDINPSTIGLDAVLKMKPVTYYLKTPLGKEDAGEQIGFVADWSEAVVPDLVTHDSNGDVHGFNYEQYTAVLTKGFQEFYAQFQTLLARVTGLEDRVNAQDAKIKALEARLGKAGL